MSEHDFSGYKHVQDAGLPHEAGKYFLITTTNELIFAQLLLSDGFRFWNCYPDSGPLSDNLIRMWKKVPNLFGQE